MFTFINMLRYLFGGAGQQQESAEQPEQTKEQIEASSGDNVKFYDGTEPSDNYKAMLSDAVKFYQQEFNMTPRVNIANDPEALPDENVSGTTSVYPDYAGQYDVNLRYLTKEGEKEEEEISRLGEATGFHPKNSGHVGSIPVHELGHALFGTLFPRDDTSSNREGEYYEGKFYPTIEDDVYYKALEDLKVSEDKDKEKTEEISGYAYDNPAEAVAESLVDYYYNRDKAAPLSRAIIRRLKSAGATYATRQAGGFDLDPSASNFVKNLRRYRAIQ